MLCIDGVVLVSTLCLSLLDSPSISLGDQARAAEGVLNEREVLFDFVSLVYLKWFDSNFHSRWVTPTTGSMSYFRVTLFPLDSPFLCSDGNKKKECWKEDETLEGNEGRNGWHFTLWTNLFWNRSQVSIHVPWAPPSEPSSCRVWKNRDRSIPILNTLYRCIKFVFKTQSGIDTPVQQGANPTVMVIQ